METSLDTPVTSNLRGTISNISSSSATMVGCLEGGSGASGPLQMLEYGKFWLQHASLVLYITHVFTGNLVREMKSEIMRKID